MFNYLFKVKSFRWAVIFWTLSLFPIDFQQTLVLTCVYCFSSWPIFILNHCQQLFSFLFHSFFKLLYSLLLKSCFIFSIIICWVVLNLVKLGLSRKFHSIFLVLSFKSIKILIKEVLHKFISIFTTFKLLFISWTFINRFFCFLTFKISRFINIL